MAKNYASKYESLVDERFRTGALTGDAVNQNYDWTGVRSIKVYSIPTAQMQDYKKKGGQRYGEPSELSGAIQELMVKMDRSFTFTIDRGNHNENMMVTDAGEALRRQLDEEVIPEIDRYRIAVMACGAGNYGTGAITKANAYDALLEADMVMAAAKVPPFGRVALVSPYFYKKIKLDTAFVMQAESSKGYVEGGIIGMVDNIAIVRVPIGYLPKGTEFLVVHRDSVSGAEKLADYKIHDNPPGINGWLVEGRVCYDAFLMNSKLDGVYIHQDGLGEIELKSEKAEGVGLTKVTAIGSSGANLLYKTGVSVALPVFEEDVSLWTALPSDGIIAASDGDELVVVSAVKLKAMLAGKAIVKAN